MPDDDVEGLPPSMELTLWFVLHFENGTLPNVQLKVELGTVYLV